MHEIRMTTSNRIIIRKDYSRSRQRSDPFVRHDSSEQQDCILYISLDQFTKHAHVQKKTLYYECKFGLHLSNGFRKQTHNA